MHRFFITEESVSADTVIFSKDQVHQITHVLRLTSGKVLTTFDSNGVEYEVVLTIVNTTAVVGRIQKITQPREAPPVAVSLWVSPIKHDHFELVLQKCTELGIRSFTPVISSRTIVLLADWQKKIERWRRIIIEAAEQSRCTMIPELHQPVTLVNTFQMISTLDRCYIAWENENSQMLVDHIHNISTPLPRNVGLFIGPEGGYSETEINYAKDVGIIPVSLGNHILRSETAAIVGSSLLTCLFSYLWRSKID